jgi:hypothetical protein
MVPFRLARGDALLFTHCGDHGLNLYFQSTLLVGQRSTIAAGSKKPTKKEMSELRTVFPLGRDPDFL